MTKNVVKTMLGLTLVLAMVVQLPMAASAAEDEAEVTEITAEEAEVSASEAATVTAEPVEVVTETGTLIEIGNTTAENTTIIIRVNRDGSTEDLTVQITEDTTVLTDSRRSADLSDWIAGDQITYTAEVGENSGEIEALTIRNRSFKFNHRGRNGWIEAIDEANNTIDVQWAGTVYTLDVTDAKMVAGLNNPASISDFEVGDRVRGRVVEDGDGNDLTWDATILVVLRRGDDLFMRVTRWVVPATIVSIPEDTSTYPILIEAEVQESKFFEEGDVNNLIGAPGTVFTISVDEETKLVRRFLGRTDVGEFTAGDEIQVIGRLSDETGYLDAEVVRNKAIQRLGVSTRLAEVISVSDSSIVAMPIAKKNPITDKRRRIHDAADWTVNVDSETKIVEGDVELTLSDVVVGDIIRVRGTANRQSHSVDANAISVVTERYNEHISNQ